MRQIEVAYIVGLGHSGSTILDLILGSHSQIESVGELINLREEVTAKGPRSGLCTCGKPYRECKYWASILNDYEQQVRVAISENTDPLDLRGVERNVSLQEKMRAVFTESVQLPTEMRLFPEKYYYLGRTILNHTGKRILCDSSKDAFPAALLYRSDYVSLKIIHLFRDLRANIESVKRQVENPQSGLTHYPGFFRTYLSVVAHHLRIKSLLALKIKKNDIIKIRYKELCLHPEQTFKRLCSFLGVPYEPDVLNPDSPRFFGAQIHHNVGGNPVRMGKIEGIRYVNRWPQNLSPGERIAFILLGGSIINKLG